jgi:hypothetical protein
MHRRQGREQIAPSPVEKTIRAVADGATPQMPLARYFLFVGAALLALLFVADEYLPKLPAAERTNAAAGVSVIRIHSDRKWPERVVFDTTLPSITSVTTGMVASAPTSVADVSPKVRVREVFAQLPLSNPDQPRPADLRKPEPKLQSKRKAMARSHIGPPVILVAQQPRVGLFGNNIW